MISVWIALGLVVFVGVASFWCGVMYGDNWAASALNSLERERNKLKVHVEQLEKRVSDDVKAEVKRIVSLF